MARMLVVAGPIAAGKSSLARRVGDLALADGWTVVVLDLDVIARMADGPSETAEERWQASHGPFAALVGGWLRAPVDLVIADGSLYGTDHVEGLRDAAPHGTAVTTVLATVSFETALVRALGDPTRGLSRNAAFLRGTHERFASHLAASTVAFDHIIDTETVSLEHAATAIYASLR